jgi:hypothetical protein
MQAGYWFCVLAVHDLQGASAYLIIELAFAETLKLSVVTTGISDSGQIITDMYKIIKSICQ